MRGYFGIGVEGVSKAMNAGNLYRSANAFGASFVFTVAAVYAADDEGYCLPRFDQIPEKLEEQAKRAALNCPEDALAVVEDE